MTTSEEELGDEQLEVRELQAGEATKSPLNLRDRLSRSEEQVWLSMAGAPAPARAALAAEALAGTLLSRPIASESPEAGDLIDPPPLCPICALS